jgi:hypothetical protein
VRPRPVILLLALAALPLAGCGSTETYANKDRPAAPVTISGSIDGKAVRLSPGSIGAGPLTILMANLTDRPQQLRFETAGRGAGIRSSTTVPPDGTGQLQVDAPRGDYTLSVRDDAVRAATLKVGAPRKSAQDTLLQP